MRRKVVFSQMSVCSQGGGEGRYPMVKSLVQFVGEGLSPGPLTSPVPGSVQRVPPSAVTGPVPYPIQG